METAATNSSVRGFRENGKQNKQKLFFHTAAPACLVEISSLVPVFVSSTALNAMTNHEASQLVARSVFAPQEEFVEIPCVDLPHSVPERQIHRYAPSESYDYTET